MRLTRPRRWLLLGAAVVLLAGTFRFGNGLLIAVESDQPSTSRGTPSDGSLEHGKRLPSRGANFLTYSFLGSLLGRNTVHHRVRDAVLAAYGELEDSQPGVVYIYGETGWPRGGPFPPHKTHQNGLSVDFMVPLHDGQGESACLPRGPARKFGYAVEFDEQGQLGELTIDHEALAAHLGALARVAPAHGVRVKRVIYDPELQPLLFGTTDGASLQRTVAFSTKRSWVRHDEHYHVDFTLDD